MNDNIGINATVPFGLIDTCSQGKFIDFQIARVHTLYQLSLTALAHLLSPLFLVATVTIILRQFGLKHI